MESTIQKIVEKQAFGWKEEEYIVFVGLKKGYAR